MKTKQQTYGRALVLGMGLACAAAQAAPKVTSFLPPNDRRYSVESQVEGQGITKAEFDSVLNKLEAFYGPAVKAKGAKLSVKRKWNDSTVNASAQQNGSTWLINMYGGLARYPGMTADGFLLVACHETGHHIGGAPKIDGNDWASNEGQSDYFGTLQCMKNLLGKEDNVAYMSDKQVDDVARSACTHSYASEQDQALCERVSMAGYVLGTVLGELGETGPVDFSKPDSTVVSRMDDDHPAAQCRLDTYFAGALCDVSPTEALSDSDANQGACVQGDGRGYGSRPLCWFKPSDTKISSPKISNRRVHY